MAVGGRIVGSAWFGLPNRARPWFGHTSVRSLTTYAKVSAEALGRCQAQTDPATRRRR